MHVKMKREPERLIIRPPSEWRSMLVRITRGCNWNRCRFCGIYPAMGQPDYSRREIGEIREDIDILARRHPARQTAFFGDADPISAGIETFTNAAQYLRKLVPELQRLTCYARASTLKRLGKKGIEELAQAGLDRVHIGLESGDAKVLRFHRKGQSPEMVRAVTKWLQEAGIEVSFYVLLGLGGRDRWQEHILATARLINQTRPEFVRIRRLWLYGTEATGTECPLWDMVRDGTFVEQTPEGTVMELRLLIQHLEPGPTFIACDHANNYINVSGFLNTDREDMMAEIDEFLALPEGRRQAHYQHTGSRI